MDPVKALPNIFRDLELFNYNLSAIDCDANCSTGKYVSCVGTSVDEDCDCANTRHMSYEEQMHICRHLVPFLGQYSYSPWAVYF